MAETRDGRDDQHVKGDLDHAGVYVCHGNLSVAGSIHVGSLKVAGDISVTEDVVIVHGIKCAGNLTIAGRLQLGGDILIANDVSAAQGIRVGGRVECGGQMISGADITVHGSLQTAMGIDAAGSITTVDGQIATLGGDLRSRRGIISGGRIQAKRIAAGTTIAAGVNSGDGQILGEILSGQIVLGTHGPTG